MTKALLLKNEYGSWGFYSMNPITKKPLTCLRVYDNKEDAIFYGVSHLKIWGFSGYEEVEQ